MLEMLAFSFLVKNDGTLYLKLSKEVSAFVVCLAISSSQQALDEKRQWLILP